MLIGVFGMILWLALGSLGLGPHLVGLGVGDASSGRHGDHRRHRAALGAGGVGVPGVRGRGHLAGRSHQTPLAPQHLGARAFLGRTLAQFLYVAAQSGIFSFLINYMTSEPPSLPSSWLKRGRSTWVEVRTAFAGSDFKDVSSLVAKLHGKADPVSAFLATKLSSSTVQSLAQYKEGTASATAARVALMQDLNSLIVKGEPLQPGAVHWGHPAGNHAGNCWPRTPSSERSAAQPAAAGRRVSEGTGLSRRGCGHQQPGGRQPGVVRLHLLPARPSQSARPCCGEFSAHKVVGLYAVLNVAACLLVFFKLGWLSVVCVFLSYFFMSIMFPTIFALGIFGLGARAKGASAYIVMGIVGGAVLPKVMGAIADHYDMSRGFIVPLVCFVLIALYGYGWPKLSRAESLHGVGASGGH